MNLLSSLFHAVVKQNNQGHKKLFKHDPSYDVERDTDPCRIYVKILWLINQLQFEKSFPMNLRSTFGKLILLLDMMSRTSKGLTQCLVGAFIQWSRQVQTVLNFCSNFQQDMLYCHTIYRQQNPMNSKRMEFHLICICCQWNLRKFGNRKILIKSKLSRRMLQFSLTWKLSVKFFSPVQVDSVFEKSEKSALHILECWGFGWKFDLIKDLRMSWLDRLKKLWSK